MAGLHVAYSACWLDYIPLTVRAGWNTCSLLCMLAGLHTGYKSLWPEYIQVISHNGQIKGNKRIENVMMYRVKSAMIRTLLIIKNQKNNTMIQS